MKKIKDTAGYIAYIYPKSLVFGIVIFVISIVAIVSDCLKKIPEGTGADHTESTIRRTEAVSASAFFDHF